MRNSCLEDDPQSQNAQISFSKWVKLSVVSIYSEHIPQTIDWVAKTLDLEEDPILAQLLNESKRKKKTPVKVTEAQKSQDLG